MTKKKKKTTTNFKNIFATSIFGAPSTRQTNPLVIENE
jgi:hypothetical protein